ncbi:MAG TPA: hypothetical protein PLF61_02835 [Candidatus Goldiibacteriota bacterium]|nr:hypothetical protein [Candidatus Goldiibacteriota bacterium]
MKKVLTLLVVSMFFAGLAFATETRVEGLGVATWQTLDDNAIVFDFAGQLSNYKNIAVIEQTSPNTGVGGVTLGLDGMSLGVFVGKNTILLGSILGDIPAISNNASVNGLNVNNVKNSLIASAQASAPVNLLYAIDLSDMSIGIGLGYVSSGAGWENKTPDSAKDVYSSTAREINALLGLTMGSIDVGLKLALPSIYINLDEQAYVGGSSQAYNEDTLDIGGFGLDLLGRINLGEALLASLGFGYSSGSSKFTTKADNNGDGKFDNAADNNEEYTNDFSNITVNLGISKEIKAQTAKAICGVMAGYSLDSSTTGKSKDVITGTEAKGTEESTSTIYLFADLGAEAKLNDTFSIRGGISQPLLSIASTTTKNLDTDPVAEESSGSDSTNNTTVSLGASATVGSFTFDVLVSQDILLKGPDFIGGDPTSLNSKIAVKYVW